MNRLPLNRAEPIRFPFTMRISRHIVYVEVFGQHVHSIHMGKEPTIPEAASAVADAFGELFSSLDDYDDPRDWP